MGFIKKYPTPLEIVLKQRIKYFRERLGAFEGHFGAVRSG
jgi:hypothetical protein